MASAGSEERGENGSQPFTPHHPFLSLSDALCVVGIDREGSVAENNGVVKA